MKFKNILNCFLLTQLLFSCNFIEKVVEFTILNKSNDVISNIQLYTSEKLDSVLIKELHTNQTTGKFLSLKKNKSDGSYIIKFDRNNLNEKYAFGYYTNGTNIENEIVIDITTDSIKIESKKY